MDGGSDRTVKAPMEGILKSLIETIGEAVIATDTQGRITLMNGVAEKLTGWSFEEAFKVPLQDVFVILSERTGETAENPIEKVLATGKSQKAENQTLLLSRTGRRISVENNAAPIREDFGTLTGVVMALRDVTREKVERREIEFLSLHDALTGLHNRRYFELHLAELSFPERVPVAVVMGAVNGLKITNDVFGHDLGDRLLCEVAGILCECVRHDDLLVRMGGDEFLLILPGLEEKETNELCGRIRSACQGMSVCALPVSISLGSAVWKDPAHGLGETIKNAENDMYKNKLLENQVFRSSLLNSIKQLLFDRCLETDRHTERLSACCIRIAEEMGLSTKEKTDLDLLAMLHDIGKIAVREGIVFKPTKLDQAEWTEMRRHTEVGYRIAQATPELFHIAEAILAHHEWWDGTGYPQKTSGMDIPKLARILSVADAFDVMTHYRPFRDAISMEEAAAEIRRNAGKQFDPYIADVFLRKVLDPLSDSKG